MLKAARGTDSCTFTGGETTARRRTGSDANSWPSGSPQDSCGRQDRMQGAGTGTGTPARRGWDVWRVTGLVKPASITRSHNKAMGCDTPASRRSPCLVSGALRVCPHSRPGQDVGWQGHPASPFGHSRYHPCLERGPQEEEVSGRGSLPCKDPTSYTPRARGNPP